MARVPVRMKAGSLQPDLALAFPWRCAANVKAGISMCVNECCGQCYFLAPGTGCELGNMKPVRCQTYPLIPQVDRVFLHRKCPDAEWFIEHLERRDERAVALLDVAIALSDIAANAELDDNSQEIDWLLEYTEDGFGGPVVWRRGEGIVVPRVTQNAKPQSKRGKARRGA